MIIDIDAHFEPGREWLDAYPKLAAKLPRLPKETGILEGVLGDLLRDLRPEDRLPREELVPPGAKFLLGEEELGEEKRRAEFEGKSQAQVADAAARVAWMDEQGIDVQNVICLAGFQYTILLENRDRALLRETMRACNDWLANTCEAGGGRLLPVATPEYSDLDQAAAELARMRERGSRIFLIPGYPVDGVAPCSPEWDRFWSTATDLAMTPMLHVGFERSAFDPGWAKAGMDANALRYFASSFRHFGAQLLLNSFIWGGVFDRHPKLTLLLAELGVGWLPWLYREVDGRIDPTSQLFLGDYAGKLAPSEYIARNVRGTPLSWATDQPLPEVMRELPDEVIVFSSDFPHFEGYTDPMGVYEKQLAELPEKRLALFYGDSMQEVYTRMGDPIT